MKLITLTVLLFVVVDLGLGDDGPLILTPLIEQNKIEEAQNASKIEFEEFGNVISYSGFLTVDKTFNSNLFFWFFPCYQDWTNAPIILWLEGGLGTSSLYGLFMENGPFKIDEGKIDLRYHTLARAASVIYVDNPAGTGFSFTNGGYAKNQTKVAEDLYNFLQQFFKLFPDLQYNKFYAGGESYAGKYVPAISYAINKKNPDADLKINLKGMIMGNGLSDPLHQFKYSEHFYELGLIDEETQEIYRIYERQIDDYIQRGNPQMAYSIFANLTGLTPNSLFFNITRLPNAYNFLLPPDYTGPMAAVVEFLNREDVRTAIHVGNANFSDGQEVFNNLVYDIPISVASWIAELLEHHQVLIYSGQLDLLVPYQSTVDFLSTLEFDGASEYKIATRYPYYFEPNVIAGFEKRAGNLQEVLIRNAGHFAGIDQPEWVYRLIEIFVKVHP